MKHFKTYLFITQILYIGLFIIGILSAVVIAYNQGPLALSLTPDGFSKFFHDFNAPLSFFGVGFAVFATWLTLGRIEQTERQIVQITDNNRFNNYYKHIEEFNKHIKQHASLRIWVANAQDDLDIWLLSLYRTFYYKHPLEFTPRMNTNARADVDKFFNKLLSSSLSTSQNNLLNIDKKTFAIYSKAVPIEIKMCAARINSADSTKVKNGLAPGDDKREFLKRLLYINMLYWTAMMYSAFLEFDGQQPQYIFDFIENVIDFRTELGI